jgi:hypothetical protein
VVPDEILGMNQIAFTIVLSFGTLVIGALASWIIAHIYYRRSTVSKDLVWTSWTASLVNSYSTNNPHLSITFDGVQIRSAAITWVVFWNNGRGTLHKEDVVPGNPLRIEPSGSGMKILGAKVVACNSSHSQIDIRRDPDGSSAVIVFEFLAKGQGAVFQVTHTGVSPWATELSGQLKEDSELRRGYTRRRRLHWLPANAEGPQDTSVRYLVKILGWALFISLPIISLPIADRYWPNLVPNLVPLTLLTIPLGFGAYVAWLEFRERFYFSLPRGLEAVSDEGESTKEYWDRMETNW